MEKKNVSKQPKAVPFTDPTLLRMIERDKKRGPSPAMEALAEVDKKDPRG